MVKNYHSEANYRQPAETLSPNQHRNEGYTYDHKRVILPHF